jgi:hypothetical protein
MVEFSWKRIFKIVGIIVLFGAVIGGVYFVMNLRQVKVAAADVLHDSRENYLDCEHMTFYMAVQKAFSKHPDTVNAVRAIPGVINFRPEEIKCKLYDQGMLFVKGQAVLEYKDRAARTKAESLLGKDFFGVPYRGYEN